MIFGKQNMVTLRYSVKAVVKSFEHKSDWVPQRKFNFLGSREEVAYSFFEETQLETEWNLYKWIESVH